MHGVRFQLSLVGLFSRLVRISLLLFRIFLKSASSASPLSTAASPSSSSQQFSLLGTFSTLSQSARHLFFGFSKNFRYAAVTIFSSFQWFPKPLYFSCFSLKKLQLSSALNF